MKLKIVTPTRIVFEDTEIDAVYAQTADGEVGILPRHIPLVAPLNICALRYTKDNQTQTVAIMGGLLRTNGNEVSVLSDAAELAAEIDVVRAKHAKERAEARLKQTTDGIDLRRAEMALARSLARLKVVKAL